MGVIAKSCKQRRKREHDIFLMKLLWKERQLWKTCFSLVLIDLQTNEVSVHPTYAFSDSKILPFQKVFKEPKTKTLATWCNSDNPINFSQLNGQLAFCFCRAAAAVRAALRSAIL
jgi:hypothetical protein